MSIGDSIKNIGKNTKEKAVFSAVGPAMAMIEGWTKDVKPENPLARFCDENFGILFESRNDDLQGIMKLLTKLAVSEANSDPAFMENKLLRFYEAFRVWYKAKKEMQNEIQEKADNN